MICFRPNFATNMHFGAIPGIRCEGSTTWVYANMQMKGAAKVLHAGVCAANLIRIHTCRRLFDVGNAV